MDKLRALFAVLGWCALTPFSLQAAPGPAAGMGQGGIYGQGAVQVAPGSMMGGSIRQIAPSAPISSGGYGNNIRGSMAAPSINRSVNYNRPVAAAPVVRSQMAPQQRGVTVSPAVNAISPARQINGQTIRRPVAGVNPLVQRPVAAQPAINLNRLPVTDFARVGADRRNARPVSPGSVAAVAASSNARRDNGRFRDSRRTPRFGYRYSNFFSPGYYCAPSAAYSYPFYPSIYVQQSYGVSYSTVYPFNTYAPLYYDAGAATPYENDPGVAEPAPEQQQQPPPPAAADNRSAPPQGQPDVLVQDVQRELLNRGYFSGRIDGLVSTAFWDALRRFQKDQQLAVTGLLNQATLFALGLN